MRGITFGTPFFETELGRVEPDSDIHFAVVLYAASCDPEVGVPRDDLAALLWPESPLESARHNLRQAMYRLRQLGVPVHLKVGQVVLSEVDTEVDLRELVHGGVHREDLLRIATQEFLPGYAPRIGPRYSAWVDELRDRVDRVRRHALVEAVRDARSQARFREVHRVARALLALDPLNETATLALAEALVMDGSKVEALRMLDEYEQEVGRVSDALRVPVRTLRRRVSECLDDALLPRQYEVPFVGRDTEFRQIREAFVATRQGRGLRFVISGEAGIGKTRIAQELVRLSVLDGANIVSYACTSGDSITPLSSLLSLIGAMLSQPGALGCAGEHLQYLRRVVSSDSATTSPGITADIAYAQLVFSLSELASAISDEAPLVLFIDDAHRLHDTSWRIFGDVVDRLPQKPVFLLLTARQLPDGFGALGAGGSDGRSKHIALGAFTLAASRSFVDQWSTKNVTEAPIDVDAVCAASGGNPFYLGELLAHRARGGDETVAPSSIRELIHLQYSTLSKSAQRVLLCAALLHTSATIVRVASILRVPPTEFAIALEELEAVGLILVLGARLQLRHDLIGDIAVGIAPPSVRQYLRALVANRLEREGRRTGDVELLSEAFAQWDRASLPERALRTGIALGDRLVSIGLSSDAARALEKTMECAQDGKQRGIVYRRLVRALAAASEWEKLANLEQRFAEAASQQFESPELLLDSIEARMWSNSELPRYGVLESIYSTAGQSFDLRLRAATLAVISQDNNFTLGDYLRGRAASLGQLTSEAPASESRDFLELILATCAGGSEAFQAATRYAQSAKRKTPRERVVAARKAGHAMRRVGRTRESIELFALSLADAEQLRLRDHQINCLVKLTELSLHLGDRTESRFFLERLRNLVGDTEQMHVYTYGLCNAEAELAFLDQDHVLAESAKKRLDQLTWEAEISAQHHSGRLARAVLSFAFPELLDPPTVRWCLSFPKASMTRGGNDVASVAIARALVAAGEDAAATQCLSEYLLLHRVEDYPVSEALQRSLPESVAIALRTQLRA